MNEFTSRRCALTLMALFLTGCTTGQQSKDNGQEQNRSLLSSVSEGKRLRCAYVVYPPGSFKDPNSGRLYGIGVEMLERAGARLGLKVEWTEEVSWGTMIEGLKARRYDIIGNVVWANSSRAKEADFSRPLFYSPIRPYVRLAEKRFDKGLSPVNDSSIKIATIDGEMSSIIAREQFGRAQTVSLPQTADISQMLLNVAQGRADITFAEPYIANAFLEKNPSSIRSLKSGSPLRVFGNCFMFRQGEREFKRMLDVVLDEMIAAGVLDELIAKYAPGGTLLKPALPYQMEQ